jgi:hypothetical protein
VAVSTYTELQAAIANWVDREDLTARTPEFIALFEAKANRLLRARPQQGQATASVDTQLAALPDDFLEMITVQVRSGASDTYSRLAPAPSDVIAAYVADDDTAGRPRFWGLIGAQLMLYPAPDLSYTVLTTYVIGVPALSDDNPTNWLLDQGPDVYLDGALAAYHEWDRNPQEAMRLMAKAEMGLAEIMAQRRQPRPQLRTEFAQLLGRQTYNFATDS